MEIRHLRGWLARLFGMVNRKRREREFAEELESHLALHIEDNLRAGMSPEEARRRALIKLGGVTLTKELRREQGGAPMIETLLQDLRFGLRMLRKNPGFSLIVTLTLALGIGANTAIFSVVNALLLRPLPYRAPERLVKVFNSQPDPAKEWMRSNWAYPRFEILRDQSQSFAAVAGFTQQPYNLTGSDEPERLQVEMVSASYFPLLGVEAVVGRAFTADEDRAPGTNLVALLSFSLWQRRFGGDMQVIGKTLELEKHRFTIVGVAPPGFRGQNGAADAWVTMMAAPLLRYKGVLTNSKNFWFQVVARLKDGVTLAQAQAEMPQLRDRIEGKYPGPKIIAEAESVPALAPLQASKVDPVIKKSFLILLAAVGLALLIACANTANLLLARAASRRREFAVRTALGAERFRVMRQLITESMLLALIGGALGALVARWGVAMLMSFRPNDNAQFWTSYTHTLDFFTVELDWRALGFNFALALLTGALFGLLPAVQASSTDINESLKEGSGGSGVGFRSLRRLSARSALVMGELALSLVLLAGAGLMIKSLARLQAVNLGYTPENLMTMAAPSRTAKQEFYEQLLARVQVLPGVEQASLGSTAPLLGQATITGIGVEGRADSKQTGQVGVGVHSVSPDYFKTLRVSLLKGRVFTDRDRAGAPRVAIINQTAAETFFHGEEPLGKRIQVGVSPSYETTEKFVEIVGVVADARYGRLEAPIEPDVYLSFLQPTDPAQTLIVRTRVDPAAIAAVIRREVLALDRNVPLTAIQTMRERVADVTSRTRFIAVLLGLFAGLALLLAAIGVYGVMAYSVSARMRELGIRIALGARKGDVLRLVLREGAMPVIAGLVLGLLAAWASLRVLQSQLYDMSATDPLTFAGMALLLALVALLACYLPARRATTVNPIIALRNE
jgi:putative ABC transport system permease protein